MNVVILIGRLTRDPEIRYLQTGTAVCGFTVAVDRTSRKDGKSEADFLNVATWGKLAEVCAEHLSKGRLVAVQGRIQTRTWQGKDGRNHRETEVVADSVRFLDGQKKTRPSESGTESNGEISDELPF